MALAMTFTLSVSASAVTFSIPTQSMSTQDNVIKVTAARAGQIAPLILGCDLVGSSNLGASSGDYNKVNSILGVFGSDINANPDPYLWNYNYNLYAADNGKSTVTNATIAESQADGTPASTEAALNILTHRPNLILNQGAGTGTSTANSVYAGVIATLPENTDSDTTNDYAPSYYTCSISTLVYQCENLINLAKTVDTVCTQDNLKTRYDDPYVIATNYDKYVWGYYFYVQEQLAEKNIQKKSVAVVSKTTDSGATWTLPAEGTSVSQNKPNRLVEYVRDNTNLLNTTSETSAALADILKCDVVIANGNGDTLRAAAAAAGYQESQLPLIIDKLPTCLYGMIMQTHENALGIPYLQSIIYGSELGINPVYAAAYFYQNFFHITDNDALQETVNTLLGSADLPSGVTTDLSQYDPKAVESTIVSGINYACSNNLTRQDDTEAWTPDMSVGIGANSSPFTDLTADWYKDAVSYSYYQHLFKGVSGTEFAPDATMNRAMVVTVLYRLAGSPAVTNPSTFTDLTADWYKDAVAWAQDKGITNGTSETTFSPDKAVTRQEFVTLLANYSKIVIGEDTASTTDLSGYTDASEVASWATDSMKWAVGCGLIQGIKGDAGTALDPAGNATRAQAAVIFQRYLTA